MKQYIYIYYKYRDICYTIILKWFIFKYFINRCLIFLEMNFSELLCCVLLKGLTLWLIQWLVQWSCIQVEFWYSCRYNVCTIMFRHVYIFVRRENNYETKVWTMMRVLLNSNRLAVPVPIHILRRKSYFERKQILSEVWVNMWLLSMTHKLFGFESTWWRFIFEPTWWRFIFEPTRWRFIFERTWWMFIFDPTWWRFIFEPTWWRFIFEPTWWRFIFEPTWLRLIFEPSWWRFSCERSRWRFIFEST